MCSNSLNVTYTCDGIFEQWDGVLLCHNDELISFLECLIVLAYNCAIGVMNRWSAWHVNIGWSACQQT